MLLQARSWEVWERLAAQRGLSSLLCDSTDESLLELLASCDGGNPDARGLIACELAYRMSLLREIAQLQADQALDVSTRGEQERALASAQVANAHEILAASKALLDNRRREGNVGPRLKAYLGNLASAVGRTQAHLSLVRDLDADLRASREALARKVEGQPNPARLGRPTLGPQ